MNFHIGMTCFNFKSDNYHFIVCKFKVTQKSFNRTYFEFDEIIAIEFDAQGYLSRMLSRTF